MDLQEIITQIESFGWTAKIKPTPFEHVGQVISIIYEHDEPVVNGVRCEPRDTTVDILIAPDHCFIDHETVETFRGFYLFSNSDQLVIVRSQSLRKYLAKLKENEKCDKFYTRKGREGLSYTRNTVFALFEDFLSELVQIKLEGFHGHTSKPRDFSIAVNNNFSTGSEFGDRIATIFYPAKSTSLHS
jgi:hypothetical protein